MELGPTGSDTGQSRFLLSAGCDGTELIPNETQFPCRTLVTCLLRSVPFGPSPDILPPLPHMPVTFRP